jgi:hypothetical protein
MTDVDYTKHSNDQLNEFIRNRVTKVEALQKRSNLIKKAIPKYKKLIPKLKNEIEKHKKILKDTDVLIKKFKLYDDQSNEREKQIFDVESDEVLKIFDDEDAEEEEEDAFEKDDEEEEEEEDAFEKDDEEEDIEEEEEIKVPTPSQKSTKDSSNRKKKVRDDVWKDEDFQLVYRKEYTMNITNWKSITLPKNLIGQQKPLVHESQHAVGNCHWCRKIINEELYRTSYCECVYHKLCAQFAQVCLQSCSSMTKNLCLKPCQSNTIVSEDEIKSRLHTFEICKPRFAKDSFESMKEHLAFGLRGKRKISGMFDSIKPVNTVKCAFCKKDIVASDHAYKIHEAKQNDPKSKICQAHFDCAAIYFLVQTTTSDLPVCPDVISKVCALSKED